MEKSQKRKLISLLTNRQDRFRFLAAHGVYRRMDDRSFLIRMFASRMGKVPNLDHPNTFNEKLQCLKLSAQNPLYTTMVDKYAVKKYVADVIGEEYIIPTYGVWNHFDEISFDSLPEQFVLKCTHDSGSLIICRSKADFDRKAAREKLESCLKSNYYSHGREWPYKNVPPRIIAEPYMEDSSSGELRDYKFFCFQGTCRCFAVHYDRFTNHHSNYYDRECNLLPFWTEDCPSDPEVDIHLPDTIPAMISLAEKLSAGIPFLRVDLYEADGRIYFGELTFFPGSGFLKFVPEEYDKILGQWLE